MKKCILLILSVLCVFSLCSCTKLAHKMHADDAIWLDATCSEPRRCLDCDYTEGEKVDHSEDVGMCIYCNKFMNSELYYKIEEKLDSASITQSAISEFIGDKIREDSVEMSALAYSVHISLEENAKLIKEIVELCGDYKSLATVKMYLESAIDRMPTYKENMSDAECIDYCSGAVTVSISVGDAKSSFSEID